MLEYSRMMRDGHLSRLRDQGEELKLGKDMATFNFEPHVCGSPTQLLRSVDLSYLKQLEQQAPRRPTEVVQHQVVASSADIGSDRFLVWEQLAPVQELYVPPSDRYGVFFGIGLQHISAPTVQWREGIMDVRTPAPGDLVITPPYRAMYFRTFVPYRILHLSLSSEMLAQAVGAGGEGLQTRLRSCFGEQDPVITALGTAVLTYVKAPGPKARDFVECVGMGIALQLLERYAHKTLLVKGKLSQQQLKLINELLAGHQDGRVTLESMAELLGMSPYHFQKLFKATLGMPPMKYTMQTRMRRARSLVEGTHKSLGDIAAEIGCPDQSHFTKMFRKYWGVVPSQLRGQ